MLDIKNLHKEKDKYEKIKLKTFNKIYDRCVREVELVNKHENVYCHVYEIPSFISGSPTYDVKECGDFLKLKFEKGGLEVEFVNPNNLFLSWLPKS